MKNIVKEIKKAFPIIGGDFRKIPGGTFKKINNCYLGTNLGGTSAKIPLGSNGKINNRSSVTYQGGT